MEIGVLILPGASPASLAVVLEALRLVRAKVDAMQGARDWVGMETPVRRLSIDGRAVVMADGSSVTVDRAITEIDDYRAILVPALPYRTGDDAPDDAPDRLAAAARWLARAHATGATIAVSGSAIDLLARADLLGGAPMWATALLPEDFKRRHPHLRGSVHATILDRGRILVSRGIAGDGELMVRLVDRILSPVMAGWLAQALGLQLPIADRLSTDPLVADAQVWLGLRYAENPRVRDLAVALAVSEQTLLRHFKRALGTSPRRYMQRLRIDAAKMQLEHSSRPVAQIAALVGYDDPKSFREAFRAFTGVSASAYRADRSRG